MLSPTSNQDPLPLALINKELGGFCGGNTAKPLAEGVGWRVLDVVCTAGPHDRPFEERHGWSSISLVMAGTFAYRSARGLSLMSSGALMLGGFGRTFECSHPHGAGDRCLSFQFTRDLFEGIAHDAGGSRTFLDHDRIPPLRALSPLIARATNAIGRPTALEEIGLELIGAVTRVDGDLRREVTGNTRDRARVADVLRYLETHRAEGQSLGELASIANLSRYHFLRTFRSVTGITPHQWIMRARLREAAERLVATSKSITAIALEVGFDDLSNFIRSFRREFRVSPRRYRATGGV